jgi:hypothetical protein
MKKEIQLLLVVFFLMQCAPASKKSEDLSNDTATVAESLSVDSALDQNTDEPTIISIDIDEFTKHPFLSDYPMVKKFLKDDEVIFNVIAEDTLHSEYRILEFDSSRIEFLDSDPSYQDELGDLICSADIRSTKFYFNQDVAIGMTEEDFLNRAGLDKSSLTQDQETGKSYYVNEIPFNDGHWKMTLWFDRNQLSRFQYEISPCFFEYDN